MFEIELLSLGVFLLGLSFGSFANLIILRLNTGEKILRGHSRCFSCSKELKWYELMPVASFFLQSGKCRSCGSKISFQYPLVELFTGILFLSFFLKWRSEYGGQENIPVFLWWSSIGFLLIVLSVYDLWHKIIPNQISYLLIIIAFLGSLVFSPPPVLWAWLPALLPALFLSALWFFSKGRWMGLGDAKLMVAGGFFLGFPQAIAALFAAFWMGGAVGIFLLLFRRGLTLKSEIPLAPFLALGILFMFFFPHIFDHLFLAFPWGSV